MDAKLEESLTPAMMLSIFMGALHGAPVFPDGFTADVNTDHKRMELEMLLAVDSDGGCAFPGQD
ncbi:hypothetical protein L914_16235, partial [Phytophthora nicotianae]